MSLEILEAANAANRSVLDGLERGYFGTHRKDVGDTTEDTIALYRKRITELDAIIALARA